MNADGKSPAAAHEQKSARNPEPQPVGTAAGPSHSPSQAPVASILLSRDVYDGINNPFGGRAYTADKDSQRSHSTGWMEVTAGSDPATWAAFSVLKGVVGYRLGQLPLLRTALDSAAGAGGAALASDCLSLKVKVDYESMQTREWFGTVEQRLTWSGPKTVLHYAGSGPPERMIVSAQATYRITAFDKVVREFGPEPLLDSMSQKGPSCPLHDIQLTP